MKNSIRIEDPIIEPFVIDIDSMQLTVKEKVVSEEGNPREDTVGYFSSFPQALKRILELLVTKFFEDSDQKTVTIREYIDVFTILKDSFVEVFEDELKIK